MTENVKRFVARLDEKEDYFYLDELKKLSETESLISNADVLKFLIDEHLDRKSDEEKVEREAEILFEKFKKEIRILELRTSFADKNIRVVLEILNTILFHYDLTDYYGTNEIPTSVLTKAQQKVSDDIEKIIQANTERKKREMLQSDVNE